jgi:hypothetical protein
MCMQMRDCDNMLVLYVLMKRKAFAKNSWRMDSWWQFTLILMVSANGMTYTNVVSVPAKKHRYI